MEKKIDEWPDFSELILTPNGAQDLLTLLKDDSQPAPDLVALFKEQESRE